jgi:hypothetical protein
VQKLAQHQQRSAAAAQRSSSLSQHVKCSEWQFRSQNTRAPKKKIFGTTRSCGIMKQSEATSQSSISATAAKLAKGFVQASVGLAFVDTPIGRDKPHQSITQLITHSTLPPSPPKESANGRTAEHAAMVSALVEAVGKHPGLCCEAGDAAVYLDMNDWNLGAAIDEAIGDYEWEKQEREVKKPHKTKESGSSSENEALIGDGAHQKVQ